jgi:hypothetical protein
MRRTQSFCRVLSVSLILFLMSGRVASAGWLSWDAGFLSGVATASALAPEPIISKGLAITAGAAQLIGLGVDALSAAPSNNQPALAALPQPGSDSAQSAAFLGSVFQTVALTGTSQDAAIQAGNIVISDFNTLITDIKGGASASQRLSDVTAMGVAMNGMANQINNLNLPLSINQAGMNSFLASVASSGLPSFESNYLLSAGWSQSEINGIASYLSSQPFDLANPAGSITLSQTLEGMASNAVPEPGTWFLLATGCAGLLGYRWRCRKVSAKSSI